MLGFSASADGTPASIYFNGNSAFGNNSSGIPPYGGTLNGNSAQFFCVDFSHHITANTGWTATVTDLANDANSTSTRLGRQSNSEQIYQAFLYLITEMLGTSDQNTEAEYQWAIGSLSSDDWNNALGNVTTTYALDQGWEVLTTTDSYGQEFLVKTPEPLLGYCCLAWGWVCLPWRSRS